MGKSDTVRLAKLRELLDKLKRGEIVQNRQLRTWLGEEGYKDHEDNWTNVVDWRDTLNSKPGDLVEYEELLRKATLLYNRGEKASLSGNHKSAHRLHGKAQAAFERALLRLEELMGDDPSLQMWLDRHCDFSAGGNLGIDPISVPRVITSRSLENQSGGISAMTGNKRQCKIRSVEHEIDKILNPPPSIESEPSVVRRSAQFDFSQRTLSSMTRQLEERRKLREQSGERGE